MKDGKIILGILAGLAVGATLGILFAPEKGEETREKLRNKGEEASDLMQQKFTAWLKEYLEKMPELEQNLDKMMCQAKADFKKAAEHFMEEQRYKCKEKK